MDDNLYKDVLISLEVTGSKVTTTCPWDTNLYGILDAFIGSCMVVGFPIEMINEVMTEYTDNIKEEKEDAQAS